MAQRSGTSVKETGAVVNATLETIREALQQGDAVRLTGFGSFGVRTRAAHTVVNPRSEPRFGCRPSSMCASLLAKDLVSRSGQQM